MANLKEIRVIQLIDSLEPGGAERMAVNYANALAKKVGFSGLVATRAEGLLKEHLAAEVDYLFLEKKSSVDLQALIRLRNYIKKHRINTIHAHSSSFFMAILLKLSCNVKIVWHDHFGNSEFLENRPLWILKWCSLGFDGIIAVNFQLQQWAMKHLWCSRVMYLPNFVDLQPSDIPFVMAGTSGKRILCLANFRPQKNHGLLIRVAEKIHQSFPDWTFHLVGKDFQDAYSESIKKEIGQKALENTVYLYGSTTAVEKVVRQSDIGILTSLSEGLPVALLEYGYGGLPVVATAVGEIPQVLSPESGMVVPSGNESELVQALTQLVTNEELRRKMGTHWKNEIQLNYTQEAVMERYLKFVLHGTK